MTIWEGGIRVPAAIWWPGHLESSLSPYTLKDNQYEYLTQYIDWYPTLMHASGKTVDPKAELDGINLFARLCERKRARGKHEGSYYGLDEPWAALRNERFKLHYNQLPGQKKIEELYDLRNDPSESINLADDERVQRTLIGMKRQLEQWFASGAVTASYMRLPDWIDRNPVAAPDGDVLEVFASQIGALENPDEFGAYIRFALTKWSHGRGQHVHPGDILEYDIFVASDSDQAAGFFVSPSFYDPPERNCPLFNGRKGVGLNGSLLVDQAMAKGRWTRCAAGIGDVAPGRSLDMVIGLHGKSAGDYHFYLDNVVIRKPDGTVRAVVWKDAKDTRAGSTWIYYNGRYYPSFSKLPKGDSGLRFRAIEIRTKPLSAAQ